MMNSTTVIHEEEEHDIANLSPNKVEKRKDRNRDLMSVAQKDEIASNNIKSETSLDTKENISLPKYVQSKRTEKVKKELSQTTN